MVDEDVRRGGEQDAELVGEEVVATGAVGEQAELLFLDPVLGVAAAAISVGGFGQVLRIAGEIGDDEPGVGLAVVSPPGGARP